MAVPHNDLGRKIGEALAFAQLSQDQQARRPGSAAPGRANLRPVAADHSGHIGKGLGRQRQCGTVEKHRGPWADDEDCGDRFI